MDIYWIWKVCVQGDLERPLALSGTLYKWLSQRGVHPCSGPIIQFQKKTSFAQDSQISYWLQLVCPRSPLLPCGFQSNLVSLESYFRGESSAVCYEGRGSLLMENVGNYRNCATWIILEIFGVYQIQISPIWMFSLLPRTFSFSLALIWMRSGSIWGRNMTFTSRIARVWVLLWWKGLVGPSFLCKWLLIVESLEIIGCDSRFFLYTLCMLICTLL